MRLIVSEHKQGTDEWLNIRAGKVTGSRAADVLTKIKTGEAAARRDYKIQILTERLTGKPIVDTFVSAEMQWGTEQEPNMRAAYEVITGRIVRESGFIYLRDMPVGCSVDGFIDNDNEGLGFIEGKCPKSSTHIGYLMGGDVPSKYMPQITHNMFVTGADFCEFVSYDPRLPENLQLFIKRVYRDEKQILEYEDELNRFLSDVYSLETKLRNKR